MVEDDRARKNTTADLQFDRRIVDRRQGSHLQFDLGARAVEFRKVIFTTQLDTLLEALVDLDVDLEVVFPSITNFHWIVREDDEEIQAGFAFEPCRRSAATVDARRRQHLAGRGKLDSDQRL